jgi:hypothetical protein
MRLRLLPDRVWWPGRNRGRRAAGRAARLPDAAAQRGQATAREPGQSPRALGQPGSHRKVAARGIGWPSNNRPSQGPAEHERPSSRAQTAITTAGGQEAASRNDVRGNGARGNGASRTGSSRNGRSRGGANETDNSSSGARSATGSWDGANRDGASRTAGRRDGANRAAARAAIKVAPGSPGLAPVAGSPSTTRTASAQRAASLQERATSSAAEPWYAVARPTQPNAGFRHCGRLEEVLIREWSTETAPAPECVTAVNRLADLPLLIKEKLAAGLDAIHVGPGGVPDLDDMGGLSGEPLPSGRATWDACAGAYGDRKIIVGSRPSPTPDVMCHEVGHALDDLDGPDGGWLSDASDFRALYGRCLPHLASEFHRHGGTLGRREFFADAFAAIASGQRPALVEMLRGDTRTALDVMLYFNVRYGM